MSSLCGPGLRNQFQSQQSLISGVMRDNDSGGRPAEAWGDYIVFLLNHQIGFHQKILFDNNKPLRVRVIEGTGNDSKGRLGRITSNCQLVFLLLNRHINFHLLTIFAKITNKYIVTLTRAPVQCPLAFVSKGRPILGWTRAATSLMIALRRLICQNILVQELPK